MFEKNNPILIANFHLFHNSSIELDKIFKQDYKYYKIILKAECKNDEDGYICMEFKIDKKNYLCYNSIIIDYINPKLEATDNNLIISKTYNKVDCDIYILNPNTSFDKTIIFNSNQNKMYGSYSINGSIKFDGIRFFIWKPQYAEYNKFTKIIVDVYGYKDVVDINF